MAREYLLSLVGHPDQDLLYEGLRANRAVPRAPIEEWFPSQLVEATEMGSFSRTDSVDSDLFRTGTLDSFKEFFQSPDDSSDSEVLFFAAFAVATILAETIRKTVPPPKKLVRIVNGLTSTDCLALACAAGTLDGGLDELMMSAWEDLPLPSRAPLDRA